MSRTATSSWRREPVDHRPHERCDLAPERLVSLMAAHHATHVIVLAHEPIDVVVLAVPVMLADPATETALAMVRRVLVSAPGRAVAEKARLAGS